MKIMKQFGLAALLVIAVAVVLGTAAPASAGVRKSQFNLDLYPPADSPLPNATGSIAMTLYFEHDYHLDGVWVSNLAPNTWYYFPLTVYDSDSGQWFRTFVEFQTNKNGKWHGAVDGVPDFVGWDAPRVYFNVYDSSTDTLVLTTLP